MMEVGIFIGGLVLGFNLGLIFMIHTGVDRES